MGAVTALLHADRDPCIAGMVLDSPFSSLALVSRELASSHTKIPGFVTSIGLYALRKSIKARAKFNINHLKPIDYVDRCFVPALFVHAKGDTFVKPSHSDALFKKYAGDKKIMLVNGDHNSVRPSYFKDSAAIFFYNRLQVEYLIPKTPELKKKQKKDVPDLGFLS